MKKYYLHNGKEQDGPFDINELKSKGLTPKTEIWHEGLSDWTTADQIEELNHLFIKTTPPPIKPKSDDQNSQVKASPKKRTIGKKILRLFLIIIGAIMVFYAVFIIVIILDEDPTQNLPTYYEQKMSIEDIEKANPTSFLSASGKYNSSFWGSELRIRGEITNIATIADYKDVTLRVTYYSKTKSVLTTKDYTLYEVYQPNSVTPFRLNITNYKDVDAINWEVVRALPN